MRNIYGNFGFLTPGRMVFLEEPSKWVDKGKQTPEALQYMQALKELKSDIFAELDIPDKNNVNLSRYTVQDKDSLSKILRKIPIFKGNRDLLDYSLAHMNVDLGIDIHTIFAGETIEVKKGKLIITGQNGEVRLGGPIDLLPWEAIEDLPDREERREEEERRDEEEREDEDRGEDERRDEEEREEEERRDEERRDEREDEDRHEDDRGEDEGRHEDEDRGEDDRGEDEGRHEDEDRGEDEGRHEDEDRGDEELVEFNPNQQMGLVYDAISELGLTIDDYNLEFQDEFEEEELKSYRFGTPEVITMKPLYGAVNIMHNDKEVGSLFIYAGDEGELIYVSYKKGTGPTSRSSIRKTPGGTSGDIELQDGYSADNLDQALLFFPHFRRAAGRTERGVTAADRAAEREERQRKRKKDADAAREAFRESREPREPKPKRERTPREPRAPKPPRAPRERITAKRLREDIEMYKGNIEAKVRHAARLYNDAAGHEVIQVPVLAIEPITEGTDTFVKISITLSLTAGGGRRFEYSEDFDRGPFDPESHKKHADLYSHREKLKGLAGQDQDFYDDFISKVLSSDRGPTFDFSYERSEAARERRDEIRPIQESVSAKMKELGRSPQAYSPINVEGVTFRVTDPEFWEKLYDGDVESTDDLVWWKKGEYEGVPLVVGVPLDDPSKVMLQAGEGEPEELPAGNLKANLAEWVIAQKAIIDGEGREEDEDLGERDEDAEILAEVARRKEGVAARLRELGADGLGGNVTVAGLEFGPSGGNGELGNNEDWMNDNYDYWMYNEDVGLDFGITVDHPHNFVVSDYSGEERFDEEFPTKAELEEKLRSLLGETDEEDEDAEKAAEIARRKEGVLARFKELGATELGDDVTVAGVTFQPKHGDGWLESENAWLNNDFEYWMRSGDGALMFGVAVDAPHNFVVRIDIEDKERDEEFDTKTELEEKLRSMMGETDEEDEVAENAAEVARRKASVLARLQELDENATFGSNLEIGGSVFSDPSELTETQWLHNAVYWLDNEDLGLKIGVSSKPPDHDFVLYSLRLGGFDAKEYKDTKAEVLEWLEGEKAANIEKRKLGVLTRVVELGGEFIDSTLELNGVEFAPHNKGDLSNDQWENDNTVFWFHNPELDLWVGVNVAPPKYGFRVSSPGATVGAKENAGEVLAWVEEQKQPINIEPLIEQKESEVAQVFRATAEELGLTVESFGISFDESTHQVVDSYTVIFNGVRYTAPRQTVTSNTTLDSKKVYYDGLVAGLGNNFFSKRYTKNLTLLKKSIEEQATLPLPFKLPADLESATESARGVLTHNIMSKIVDTDRFAVSNVYIDKLVAPGQPVKLDIRFDITNRKGRPKKTENVVAIILPSFSTEGLTEDQIAYGMLALLQVVNEDPDDSKKTTNVEFEVIRNRYREKAITFPMPTPR